MNFHLSPNEEAAVLQQERERRRKLRIKQVREQERLFARKVRNDVRQRRSVELKVLAEQLQDNWLRDKQEKKDALKKIYEKNLKSMGEGHRAAANQEPQDDKRAALATCNKRAAQRRHNVALNKLHDEQDEQKQLDYAHILARITALEIERARAAKIASLPPPIKESVEDAKPSQPVKCVDDFSTTHYQATAEFVERAEPHEQGDARAAAQQEEDRLKEERQSEERESNERKEKAILRHKHAHKRALLEQDMDRLMGELGQMEQADRRRRQAIVARIPHQVFQPPHRRLEEREEQQQDMEQAFEDMYMANTELTGDLTLALEPKVPEEDHDLDLTTEESSTAVADEPGITLQRPPAFPRGVDDVMGKEERKPPSRSETLQTIMSRIHSQRQEWQDKSKQDLSSVGGSSSAKQPSGVTQPSNDEPHMHRREADNRSESTTALTSSSSGTASRDKSSELSEHPITTDDNGTAPSESLEGGYLGDDVRSEPAISGNTALMHPMENAAKLRATKLPDIHQQKKEQQRLMQIDDEQRQRFARQQLDSHTERHKHLQTLQQNLEERQQALNRQIQQQQSTGERYDVPVERVSSKSSLHFITHHKEIVPAVQGIGHQKRAQSEDLNRDLLAVKQNQQPVLEGHEEPTEAQLQDQQTHPGKRVAEDTPVTNLTRMQDGQLPDTAGGKGLQKKTTYLWKQGTQPSQDAPVTHTHINRTPDVDIPKQFHHTTGDRTSQQQRIHDYQQQLLAKRRQSQDILQEAQARLQQRRAILLKQYPELDLPDYSPYKSRLQGQEADVFPSHAEKELGPIFLSSGQHTPSFDSQSGYQLDHKVTAVDQLRSSFPLGHVASSHGFNPESAPAVPLVTSQSSSVIAQHSLPQDPLVRRTPPQVSQSVYTPDQPENFTVYEDETETHKSKHAVAISNEQAIFKEFLKQQRDKLEQQNMEHQYRLKEKQEQLKELVKRQMEQYRDQFLAQQKDQVGASGQDMPTSSADVQMDHLEFDTTDKSDLTYFNKSLSMIRQNQIEVSTSLEDSQLQQEILTLSDGGLMQESSNFPCESVSRSHHPPPTRLAVSAQMVGVHQPHELSTIMEVDTPQSEKKKFDTHVSLTSSESTSVSNNEQEMSIHLQKQRSHVEMGISKDQNLLLQTPKEMSSGLEGSVTHMSLTNPGLSAKHSNVSQLQSVVFAQSPVTISKTPVCTLEQYHESLPTELGVVSLPAHSQDMHLYGMSNFATSHHRRTAVDSDLYKSIHHANYDPKQTQSQTKHNISILPSYREMETPSNILSIPEQSSTNIGSEVSVLSGHVGIPRTTQYNNPTEHYTAVDQTSLPQSPDTSIPVASVFDRSTDSQFTMRRQGVTEDSSFPLYAHDVNRGVNSYTASKVLPQTSVVSTTIDPDLASSLNSGTIRQQQHIYQNTTAPISKSVSTEPVIEIFQPMVDNSLSATSISSTAEESLGREHFPPLRKRSFGSRSSSSLDDTHGKNNDVTVWRTPPSTERRNAKMEPLPVEGVVHRGFQKLPNQSFSNESTGFSTSEQVKGGEKQYVSGRYKWKDILSRNADERHRSAADQGEISMLSQHPLNTSLDHTGLESFKMHDVGTFSPSHDLQSTSIKESHHHHSYQPGSIQISSVPGIKSLHPVNMEVIGSERNEQEEASLTQHSIDSSFEEQANSQKKDASHQPVNSPPMQSAFLSLPGNLSIKPNTIRYSSSVPSDTSPPQPSQTHGHSVSSFSQPEISGYSLDPSYTGFQPVHTSSQITESIELSRLTSQDDAASARSHRYAEVSAKSLLPSDKQYLLHAKVLHESDQQVVASVGRYSDESSYLDLSQHRIEPSEHPLPNDSTGSGLLFNQPYSHQNPSKEFVSSIEESRSQLSEHNFKAPLMSLFSDVSISQQSMSFESEQGHMLSGQGQWSSETKDPTFSVSDRYSLPWPHGEKRRSGLQLSSSNEGTPTIHPSWQAERSEFMGQVSLENADHHFQPLHEMTSSTLPRDEHTESVETGIMEEPDLTLVSLNTTQSSFMADAQQDQLEPQWARDTVSSQGDDVEDAYNMSDMQSALKGKENIEPTDTSDSSALSLQEAFAKRKTGFIQDSKTRQDNVKIRAKEQSATAFSTTVANRKKPKQPKTTTGTKPSSKTLKSSHEPRRDLETSHSLLKDSKPKHTTRSDRKAGEKKMYQRTSRLYGQLTEVKKAKVEKERKDQYAANRQKRKEFEQKLQNRLSKWAKRDGNEQHST